MRRVSLVVAAVPRIKCRSHFSSLPPARICCSNHCRAARRAKYRITSTSAGSGGGWSSTTLPWSGMASELRSGRGSPDGVGRRCVIGGFRRLLGGRGPFELRRGSGLRHRRLVCQRERSPRFRRTDGVLEVCHQRSSQSGTVPPRPAIVGQERAGGGKPQPENRLVCPIPRGYTRSRVEHGTDVHGTAA